MHSKQGVEGLTNPLTSRPETEMTKRYHNHPEETSSNKLNTIRPHLAQLQSPPDINMNLFFLQGSMEELCLSLSIFYRLPFSYSCTLFSCTIYNANSISQYHELNRQKRVYRESNIHDFRN